MKAVKFLRKISVCLGIGACLAFGVCAQPENPKTRERVAPNETKTDSTDAKTNEKTETVTTPTPATDNRTADEKTVDEKTAEAAIVLPYYNNYLREYRLGPNDIITVEVFGQCPDYCKTGITVPPTARISYPLIREGILVGGKTVEEVADEITKKLDEYIIEPKVTVTLDKAMSVRYSVMGKVNQPGIRIMDRKVSLYEAIIEAGGISKDGDRKKVAIISYYAQGRLTRKDVNLTELESGKIPMIFLNPGDQVFVGGKGFTFSKLLDVLGKASAVRLLFGSPF